MFDDDLPMPRKTAPLPRKLEGVSAEELEEYLVFLDEEKARTQAALAGKGGMAAAAEALFRS